MDIHTPVVFFYPLRYPVPKGEHKDKSHLLKDQWSGGKYGQKFLIHYITKEYQF